SDSSSFPTRRSSDLDRNPKHYFSMHIRTSEALDAFKTSGLPYNRMIVYIGPEIKESNQDMYAHFNERGVMCMISTASSYDKLERSEEHTSELQSREN